MGFWGPKVSKDEYEEASEVVGWQLEKKVLAAVTAWFKRLDTNDLSRAGALEAGRGGADKPGPRGFTHVLSSLYFIHTGIHCSA